MKKSKGPFGTREEMNATPTTIEDLTQDILTDIFARVPVKSIGLSRCVCKPWLSLLTNSDFLKIHFDRSNLRNPNLLVKTENALNPSNVFQTLDTNTLDEFQTLNLVDLPPWIEIKVVGSCDGLVCLWGFRNYVSILNPSTREVVELPSYPFRDHGHCPKNPLEAMGFGFDPESKVYKVVIVSFIKEPDGFTTPFTMVYALGDNSWRTVKEKCFPSLLISPGSHASHLNGILHWVGSCGRNTKILSFDLRNERFGEVPWFDFSVGRFRSCTSEVWDGCLAAFCCLLGGNVDIWTMKDYGVQGSWVKVLSIATTPEMKDYRLQGAWGNVLSIARARAPDFIRPLVLMKNGEVLIQVQDKQVVLYNPVNQRIRVPVVRGARSMFNVCTYHVDALTSIKSLMDGKQNRAVEG